MFDAVRDNKKIVQIFLALIMLPFAFFGVDSYVNDKGAGSDVAAVGDGKITQQQFSQAWREQIDQLRTSLGAQFDPAAFDTPAARRAMLDQLINQRLLLEEARRLRLGTGDDQLRDVIARVPALQDNGKFSLQKYEELIRAQGMSQAGFEAKLRQDLTVQQIAVSVSDTAITSRAAAGAFVNALAEQRQVAESRVLPDAYLAQVKVEDAEIQKHYEANQKDFQEPEQARVAYVVLSLEALKAQTAVTPEEVSKWFEGHRDRYQVAEERRASHILIALDSGAAADVKEKARAKAEELLKQVKANPASFGELAKKNSQDPGSAEKNGDLGFFARGAMVKSFEDAVFGLKEGDVSDVVASDFGFHIIKLTGIKAGKQKTLDEVRAEIEAELRQQAGQKKYAEAAEAFSNLAYEQSDSLQPLADKFKLQITETGWLPKGVPVVQKGSPLANPKLLTAVFGEDAVKNKRNTAAIEIAQNTIATARVIEHKPAALRPLDKVRDDISKLLARRAAAALAVKDGEAKLAEYLAGKDAGLPFAAAKPVSRLAPGGLTTAAVKAVFKTDMAKTPAYAGVILPEGGYAIYKVLGLDPNFKLDEQQTTSLQTEFANLMAQAEFSAYLTSLRNRHKVSVNTAALEAK